MSVWHEAMDELGQIERDAAEGMTIDQRLKAVEVRALLSISQELSLIHHEGINPEYSSR